MDAAKKENPTKPKYGMWSNAVYMIRLAWRTEKSVIWLCLIQAALAVATSLLGLFIVPTVLATIEAAAPLAKLLSTIAAFALTLMLVGAATAYVGANTLFGRVAVRGALVSQIHDKFSQTSFPNTTNPSFLKRLEKSQMAVQDNSQATEAVWKTLTELMQNGAGFIIYLALLASLDPLIIIITLATTVVGYFITKEINNWGYRHREEAAGYSHRMNYASSKAGDHTFAKDIRIFGMQNWLENVYSSTLNLYQAFCVRREKVYIWANVIDVVLALVRNGIAYTYLITLTLRKDLGAAQFLLHFTAVGGFTTWVSGILAGLTTLHKQSLDLSTVREFLESEECFKFEDGETLQPDPTKAYEIELRNVAFRYPGADHDTLHGINLTIKAGEKLAIVGLNGAGKTTLIKLICGFYDPSSGQVLLNGRDIKAYNRRDYYRHFSAVFQQFSLLASTITGNVAQATEGIDMAKVQACVEKAGLKRKVESLPDGYGTHLGKQVFEDAPELSGGELQRLMLARALYKDAPMIVLDEPTAALDPIAESDIYQRYNELTEGRTSIYISHRLASTRFCDRILFVEDGVIKEEGTHAALLGQGGRYADLFAIQSRYYREGGGENDEQKRCG
ncbi:MAG: ABC transporter ATP-binding protein [Bacillota bacterium]